MSNETVKVLQDVMKFTETFGTAASAATKGVILQYAELKNIDLKEKKPVTIPEELINRATIKNMPIGFTAYTVPWAMVMLEGGELWITESFTITQHGFGTSEMRIRRVDGGVLVDRQTARPMGYEAGKQTTSGLLPVLGFFNDEPKRGVRW